MAIAMSSKSTRTTFTAIAVGRGSARSARIPPAVAEADPFLGMFRDEPDLVDEVTRSAMEARERDPLRSEV